MDTRNETKELRVRIDGLGQLTKGLEEPTCYIHQAGGRIIGDIGTTKIYNLWVDHSKEIGKAIDSLFISKAWLGKILGALGEDSPYPKDGTRKTVKDIEPTADTGVSPKKGCSFEVDWSSKSHIEKVDWLRQEISKVVKEIVNFGSPKYAEVFTGSREIAIARTNCYTHLSEARFWLGSELERINNEK